MRFVAVLTVLAAATAALALNAAPQQAAPQDFESLPPEPSQVQAQLNSAPISLEQAIAAAEKEMQGISLLARFTQNGGDPVYEVVVISNGVQKKVSVDGKTGKVTGAMLTLPSAVRKALEKTGGGKVKDAVTNFNADPAQYSVVIFKKDQRYDIIVNAVDGSIISETLVSRFPGMNFTGELQETDSGLMYVDIVEGTGAAPEPSSVVKVHYTGYFTNGQDFDSSVKRGEPAQFNLSGVIPGWTEGVGGMKVGGKRKLIVPYKLAYGEKGRGPIPAKATLVFDVELLEVMNVPSSQTPR